MTKPRGRSSAAPKPEPRYEIRGGFGPYAGEFALCGFGKVLGLMDDRRQLAKLMRELERIPGRGPLPD